MGFLVVMNLIITICYYVIAAFFLFAIVRTFLKSENGQDSAVYCLMMIPFVLRLLRLK